MNPARWLHRAALAVSLVVPLVTALVTGLAWPASGFAAEGGGEGLRARHATMKDALDKSPFKRPLVLQANASSSESQGDAYAVIQHPFATVAATLQRPERWCDMLILQNNIKRCRPAGSAPKAALQVAVGRKFDQPAEDAYQVEFKFSLAAAGADYLSVQLAAETGPFGTRDYRMAFEAVPLDAARTFIHLSYSYSSGLAARMATGAYLATLGRNKVGFTVVRRDDKGEPVYVGGVQGIAERNTMRNYLAVEALLDSLALPPEQQLEKRLHDWFAATERYPRQLHEMEADEYMAMKRKETTEGAGRIVQ